MDKRINRRINLSRYKREWKIIFEKIDELRASNQKLSKKEMKSYFHNYVNKKMHSLYKDYTDCPDCVLGSLEKRIKMQHYVNNNLYKMFDEISKKSNLPIATIVDKLIINPLLIE